MTKSFETLHPNIFVRDGDLARFQVTLRIVAWVNLTHQERKKEHIFLSLKKQWGEILRVCKIYHNVN